MSGLRQLVTGSDMCTASDGAGPSNAVGALVDQLLGGASKTQEQLRDLPIHQGPAVPGHVSLDPSAAAAAASAPRVHLPGLPQAGPSNMAHLEAFFPSAPHAAAGRTVEDMVGEFERMAMVQGRPGLPPGPPAMAAAPPQAVAANLKVFLDSARVGGVRPGAHLAPGGPSALSVPEACRIRDRSTILARQLYAEQGPHMADQQVAQLLESLSINPAALPSSLNHVHDASWHEVWAQGKTGPVVAAEMAAAAAPQNWDNLWQQQQQQQQQQHRPGMPRLAHPPSTGWVDEFAVQAQASTTAGPSSSAAMGPPGASWAEEFAGRTEGDKWAEQLATEVETGVISEAGTKVGEEEARAQSARLVAALSADGDPKMKSSKFLHFLSKMSRGELSFQDNKVVERPVGEAWANEFGTGAAPASWAEEFAGQQQQQPAGPANAVGRDWADAFAAGLADDIQIGDDEESRQQMEAAWAALGKAGAAGANPWVTEFAEDGAMDAGTEAEWDELYRRHADAAGGVSSSGRHEYVFAENNPFLGDAAALEKGKQLFKAGLLTEAALALEAEVRAHPGNAEAWRLLGTVHAENDDDKQAIAAMDKALQAGPEDLEVLLSLGVSHTNELDAGEALVHLNAWLSHHPTHSAAAAAAGPVLDSSQALSHSVKTFEAALASTPADPDLHMAVGVLHHLSRNYHAAIKSFQKALELRPQDYSLWNKLGATLANYSHSADAISAYQRALDLKPNYMRAWTNMGISYANIGDYTNSAAYYTRALSLNPHASHVWGYLRTSLACAGRGDLMAAVEAQDIGGLQKALPIQQ